MRRNLLLAMAGLSLAAGGFAARGQNSPTPYADTKTTGSIPGSYGRLVAAIPDQIGTDLVFEDAGGIIRFVSMTGRKEGELARYDQAPTHGGIPKSYGHLVTAVVDSKGTELILEDKAGVIRFVTITGAKQAELRRD